MKAVLIKFCCAATNNEATFIKKGLTDSLMNCEVCSKKVGETFLKKVIGTYVKDSRGKKRLVCFECQKKFNSKEKILENIK